MDLCSPLSGHKLHAPKGVGALYMHAAALRLPNLIAGGAQERGRRAGTENVAGIVALRRSHGSGVLPPLRRAQTLD